MLKSPQTKSLVLVVDDDEAVGTVVSRWLQTEGYAVELFRGGEPCLAAMTRTVPDAVCLDLNMPGLGGLETLERIRAHYRLLPVIIMTGDVAVDTVVSAMQLGACDYLTKPIDFPSLSARVRDAVDRFRASALTPELEQPKAASPIVGVSPAMKPVYQQLDLVAESDITVLICGESGTGKELVARAIHERSARRKGPFVALNCAAVPEFLQESELFGHERGAFSGAVDRRRGRFEQAHRGTLFLDEVAELSLSLQAKLLRVVQEKSFQRVGGAVEIESDFRLVAATHRNLDAEVKAGRFREDLFFRLAVFELAIPRLRDRPEDVLLLAEHFLSEFASKQGLRYRLSPDARRALSSYEWPGNVRELRNRIERAVVVSTDGWILPQHLGPNLESRPRVDAGPDPGIRDQTELPRRDSARAPVRASAGSGGASEFDLPVLNLAELERRAIETAMRRTDGNLTEVVRLLGIGRTTLYRRLKKYRM